MIATYAQIAFEIILAIGAIIFAIASWRNGKSQATTEAVQAYKDLLEVTEKKYQTKTDDMQRQINEQSGKIGELTGLVKGKDSQIADYKQILENRNPNLENILTQMVGFMETVHKDLQELKEHVQKPVIAESKTTTTVLKS